MQFNQWVCRNVKSWFSRPGPPYHIKTRESRWTFQLEETPKWIFYSGLAFIADLPENIGWNFVFMGLFINHLSILSLRTCDLGASKCKDRGVVVIITAKLHSTNHIKRMQVKIYSYCVGSLLWWESTAIVPGGNKTWYFTLFNHHYHNHHNHHNHKNQKVFITHY